MDKKRSFILVTDQNAPDILPMASGTLPTDAATLVTAAQAGINEAVTRIATFLGRYPAKIGLISLAAGFTCGLVVSLAIAAESLYVCTSILD